jgi:hypothetical protein
MADGSISLRTLARELNTETSQVVAACRREGVARADWVEVAAAGGADAQFRGRVGPGLAETIRQWGREGRFGPAVTAAQRRADWVASAAGEAAVTRSNDFGDELEAIVLSLRAAGVDVDTAAGRSLAWDAWREFLRAGTDYERWTGCQGCAASFRPTIDRRFVGTFLSRYVRPPGRWRAAERNLFCCPACRRPRSVAAGRARRGSD